MYNGPLGDYGAELRRQQRLEAIVVNQMVSPASTFARRQYSLYKRSQPRAEVKYNLPKVNWAAIKAMGRFTGPRI